MSKIHPDDANYRREKHEPSCLLWVHHYPSFLLVSHAPIIGKAFINTRSKKIKWAQNMTFSSDRQANKLARSLLSLTGPPIARSRI
jgi:hypothetical protein